MSTDHTTNSVAPYLTLSMDDGSVDGNATRGDKVDEMHDALIDAPEQRRARLQSVGFDGLGQASTFSSISNLANTIMGSGMLGLPHAFAESGYVLGTIFLLIAATAASAALHMLSVCAQRTGTPSSFYSVAKATVPKWTFLIDLAVGVKCFGVATSYLIVVADLMPPAIKHINEDAPSFWKSRLAWVFLSFAIVAPFSLFKRLDALKWTSALSVVFVYFLTIIVIAHAIPGGDLDPCESVEDDETCKGSESLASMNLDTMRILPIFIFGFTCHQNIFTVCNELRRPSIARVDRVITGSVGMALLVYLIIAICGYATYGSNVESDILESYPENTLLTVVRMFVSFLVIFAYPLQAHPARMCFMALWKASTGGEEPSVAQGHFRYWTITLCFLAGTLTIAMSLDDLGVMLSIVGATGSTMVSYILPGIMYYTLYKDERPDHWLTKFAFGMFIAGMILMPVCLVFVFV